MRNQQAAHHLSSSAKGPYTRPTLARSPTSQGKMALRSQVRRPYTEVEAGVGAPLNLQFDLVDPLCNVETGEGCEEYIPTESVEVELGNGMEPVRFDFELGDPDNTIKQIKTGMPLGVVFEDNDEGEIVVAQVKESGNAYSAGVRAGDILRASTCVPRKSAADELQALIRGREQEQADVTHGLAEKKKALFVVDGAPFAKAVAEIRSNEDLDGVVNLVVERPAPWAEAKTAEKTKVTIDTSTAASSRSRRIIYSFLSTFFASPHFAGSANPDISSAGQSNDTHAFVAEKMRERALESLPVYHAGP
jgi:hypothetical protein